MIEALYFLHKDVVSVVNDNIFNLLGYIFKSLKNGKTSALQPVEKQSFI